MDRYRIVRVSGDTVFDEELGLFVPVRVDTKLWSGEALPSARNWDYAHHAAVELAAADGQEVRLIRQKRRHLGRIALPLWRDDTRFPLTPPSPNSL